tara:strand:+ start:390 stop:1259 length:870 start_codon:yes stop_codon:yes gene_type:complete
MLPALIGLGVGLYGAHKQSQAGKKAAKTQNAATEAQYKYDVQAWEMQKQAAIAKRDYAVQEIQLKADNEARLAAYKDATNLQNYNYNLQIRNQQQDLNERMYAKSEDIFDNQISINAAQEKAARMDERRKLQEIETQNRYERQDAMIEALEAEGSIRALGQTGRSRDKLKSVATLRSAKKLDLLGLSLDNATVASNQAIRAIGVSRAVSDLNAYAKQMLDPGEIPMPVQPIETPIAEYIFPRVFEDYDFGPEPIKGAMISPSAASAQVWGSAIQGIAGFAGDFVGSLMN